MFSLGEIVVITDKRDINFGLAGRIVGFGFGGMYIRLNGDVLFYFTGMVENAE